MCGSPRIRFFSIKLVVGGKTDGQTRKPLKRRLAPLTFGHDRQFPVVERADADVVALLESKFARDIGILEGDAPYERVVATQFSNLWK